ncbi:hypothetical protein [Alteraurantiacibacter aquimixticola]|uniref:Uncharacterized protein n=1 Tax=Alteraurantiacibacter aquimixticola TaxID=2489173 RepID=A0A4T3EZY2_9SPHN|nr:hypothetical protein [Alteraurantiacibacter aquimixticola]TIX50214.1 hypothetical protein E5222_07950 [Alteraurantiacibacter aquimixticola]
MEEERILRAMARIKAATRRIEAAATVPPVPVEDSALAERHEKLRKEAMATLAQIDSLIGEMEA